MIKFFLILGIIFLIAALAFWYKEKDNTKFKTFLKSKKFKYILGGIAIEICVMLSLEGSIKGFSSIANWIKEKISGSEIEKAENKINELKEDSIQENKKVEAQISEANDLQTKATSISDEITKVDTQVKSVKTKTKEEISKEAVSSVPEKKSDAEMESESLLNEVKKVNS